MRKEILQPFFPLAFFLLCLLLHQGPLSVVFVLAVARVASFPVPSVSGLPSRDSPVGDQFQLPLQWQLAVPLPGGPSQHARTHAHPLTRLSLSLYLSLSLSLSLSLTHTHTHTHTHIGIYIHGWPFT